MEIKQFSDVYGHKEIIGHLQTAVRTGEVSHAYLFDGEGGSGKRTLAQIFAMLLLCRDKDLQALHPEPCGHCASCIKVSGGNHPDLIFVTHEKPNLISVDEIRTQVVETVPVRPYESPYKVYIIDDADKMNPQAQNALLKTLEEPPSYVVILLLSDNRDAMLPTVLSRCVSLSLRPLSNAAVVGYLTDEFHLSTREAELIASYAQGNIGRAKAAAMSGDFSSLLTGALRILTNIRKMGERDAIAAIADLAKEKQSVYEYLDVFTIWYRDVLLYKATKDPGGLTFRDKIEAIAEQAKLSSYEGLQAILSAINKARIRLRANVNFETTMELLFLTMMEN